MLKKSDLRLSSSSRKALCVQLGEAAGSEVANLLQSLADRVAQLERSKVSIPSPPAKASTCYPSWSKRFPERGYHGLKISPAPMAMKANPARWFHFSGSLVATRRGRTRDRAVPHCKPRRYFTSLIRISGANRMNEKIESHHRSRLAVVYVRQSSPTQVRNNLESVQRQRDLAQSAEQLGWPASQVRVIEERRARSGSSREGRDAYHELCELVVGQQVGVILAVRVSRWARDGVAWQLLLRDCMFEGVLLADEHHLYDPKDSHDHVSLGIQGVLAEYELHRIREQTIQCWWNKARDHHMFPALPTGVVEADGKLEKHPDRRVRHSFERLFAKFNECSSVIQLSRVAPMPQA